MLWALLIGVGAALGKEIFKGPLYEPLVVALLLGIVVRSFMWGKGSSGESVKLLIRVLLPLGVVFYVLKNFNFIEISQIKFKYLALLIIVSGTYIAVILALGKAVRLHTKLTFLLANGSAVCGASAIAITTSAIDAESDDVSISLISVAVATLLGMFVLLPFLGTLFEINNGMFALASGAVMQFTGSVKAAIVSYAPLSSGLPLKEAVSFGLLIKSARYLILFATIPLFASIVRKKAVLPLALWLFLIFGILGTCVMQYFPLLYKQHLGPFIGYGYNISWSVVMAAIGLNADAKKLLSDNGIKALIVAILGFCAAVAVFFAGAKLLNCF